MADDHISKQRVALLVLVVLLLADTWWLVAAALDGFQRVDFPMLLLGAALQAFGIRATVRKAANVTPGRGIRSLFIVASLAFGAANVWYGLLHGGEARVSPSIWKQR